MLIHPSLIEPAKARRTRLMDSLKAGDLCFVPANAAYPKSRDMCFDFFQNRDFFYLLPVNESEAILVLDKSDGNEKTILFCHENSPEYLTWEGRRLSMKDAVEVYGVGEARALSTFQDFLKESLPLAERVLLPFAHRRFRKQIFTFLDEIRYGRATALPQHVLDTEPLIGEMRLFKDESEAALLSKACELTTLGHKAVMRQVKEGMSEQKVAAIFESAIRLADAQGLSFPTIAAAGENATVLHYAELSGVLKPNELLLLDAGAYYSGYAGDVTRTFPVNGTFEGAAKDIYALVLSANESVIENITLGASYESLHKVAVRVITEGLVQLKLLEGDVDGLIESGAHKDYFMHGTGHWLGLDVHDTGAYKTREQPCKPYNARALEAGMVFTVEPGLYFPKNVPLKDERFAGIGVRVEDDILLTKTGAKNLTTSAPKRIDEIEAFMRG